MKSIKHITLQQVQHMLHSNEDLQLLDVREESEHEAYNIGGMLIPLAEVLNRAGALPKDKPIIVYCRKGIRSQIAIQKLEEKFGFSNLYNLQGGIGEKKP